MYGNCSIKEPCDKMSTNELIERVKEICCTEGIPTDGWKFWFYNSPGPKCIRRIVNGDRTHTAYVQPMWIDVFADPIDGTRTLIAKEGLAA